MLCRAACRFSTLKALLASTNKIPSVEVFEKSFCMACIAASQPPTRPAHNCSGQVASAMSWPIMLNTALEMIRRGSSPIAIGLTPGFLSKGTSLHVTKAQRNSEGMSAVHKRLPTEASAEQRSCEAEVYEEQRRLHAIRIQIAPNTTLELVKYQSFICQLFFRTIGVLCCSASLKYDKLFRQAAARDYQQALRWDVLKEDLLV